MTEESKSDQTNVEENAEAQEIVAAGKVSSWLSENGFNNEALEADTSGIELIKVDPEFLVPIATALYAYGFNYLQCQGAYDEGAGKELVSFYHLIKVDDNADTPEEVRIKVYLPRENPVVASVYWIWKSADWQERESYDMYGIIYEGHPNLKRILLMHSELVILI